MNGKVIRQAAGEQIKGRRGFLLLAVVLSNLPNTLCTQILPRMGMEVLQILSWLISLLCALLALGVIKIALEQAEGKKKSYKGLFFAFQRGVLLNALLMTVVLNLFSMLISTATTPMGIAGMVISLIAAMLLELLFFPIRYYFVLYPEQGLLKSLNGGLKLGIRRCDAIFIFNFWLTLPIITCFIVGFMLVFLSYLMPIVVLIITPIGLVALFWYLPYVTLAQAMFAKELILDEERVEPPPPPPKHMRLVKKDGWCRVNTATGKGAKNLVGKKDGEAIER